MPVAVGDLRVALDIRTGPTDGGHVRALADVADSWPPIVVQAETNVIIDGVHRVAAARLLGLRSILAVVFAGDDDAALVEALRANSTHGLPLTVDDRQRAAERLLAVKAMWSDRRIAEVCGLAARSVARLRGIRAIDDATASRVDRAGPETRVGRDGRGRPLDVVALRSGIADALHADPTASLRVIAARVGASPETVRDVRNRLARGDDPVPSGVRRSLVSPGVERSPDGAGPRLGEVAAFQSTPDRAAFAAWFDGLRLDGEWRHYVGCVPLSRVYEIADESHRRAQEWIDFANAVNRLVG